MMGWIILLPLLLIAVIAIAIGWRPDQQLRQTPREPRRDPLEILKARYARGEIGRDEYEEMRRELQS